MCKRCLHVIGKTLLDTGARGERERDESPETHGSRYTNQMPVFRLDDRLVFPPVHLAEDGLLALGGDLRPERLLLGYTQGIIPWYAENLPILWHSPDPRMVM